MRRATEGKRPAAGDGAVRWRIGPYIRLSKEDGEEESLSVVNQRKIIDEFIEKHFAGEAYEVIDYYVDDGKTGTDHARPDFQRLIGDVEAGRVNCFLCKNLARAFRNYADQGFFLESFFPRHGARFISIAGPRVDTYTNPEAVSGMEVPIAGLMNDRYAAKTSEDVRRTLDTKRRRGEFIGAFAPYGYQKDPGDKNRLVVDEEAAQVVRDIYGHYVHGGLSKRGIAKHLNRLGTPNPTAYKRGKGLRFSNPHTAENDGLWSPKTVSDILKNRVYLGHMVQGRQRVVSYKVHDRVTLPEESWMVRENTHEAILPQALFDSAQTLSARGTRAAGTGMAVSLFSGFVRCADCRRAMQRSHARGKVYLICRTSSEKSCERCARHAIREDVLEEAVLAAVRRQVALVAGLDDLIREAGRAPAAQPRGARIEAMLQSRRQEHERLSSAIDSLYLDWKAGDISRADYGRMKDRFAARREGLAQRIAALEGALAQGEPEEAPGFAAIFRCGSIERLDRSLLAALVDAIYIGAHKEVTIAFKFADPFPALALRGAGGTE